MPPIEVNSTGALKFIKGRRFPNYSDIVCEIGGCAPGVAKDINYEFHNNILVQTQFVTAGNGAPGTSTLGFEVINMPACSNSSACSSSEKATFATSVVRYEKTVTTEATVCKSD